MDTAEDTEQSNLPEVQESSQEQGLPDTATPANESQDATQAKATDNAAPVQQKAQPAANQQSLTTPKDVALTASSQQDAIDPESFKRLRDEKSQWGRQMAELKRNYEQTRQQLSQFQQERERTAKLAEQQKLKLYDYRHPEHSTKFQPILQKADIVRQQLSMLNQAKPPEGLTPEQGAMWKEQQKQIIIGSLNESEQQALDEYSQYTQQFQRDFSLNPSKAITQFVQPMLEQFWQSKMSEQQASHSVDQDLNDPVLGPIFKEYAEPINEMIEKLGGTDEAYEMAKHHALVYAQNKAVFEENARLKQQLSTMGVKVGAAETQQQLAKTRASITRDTPAKAASDPYSEAKKWALKNGVNTASKQFFDKIRELEGK